MSPLADMSAFCGVVAVAFCSGSLVAAEVHGLEWAEVVASGGDGCDVVSRWAHWVWCFERFVDGEVAESTDEVVVSK